MPYRIQSIHPKGNPAIELGQLTVLVGPNNCGKSQTLKDIREYTSSGSHERLVVLDEISSTLPDEAELREGLQIRPHEEAIDHLNVVGVKDDLLTQVQFTPQERWFEDAFRPGTNRSINILQQLGTCLIAYLGAEARFKLTTSSPAFNPRVEAPSNAIQSLYAADANVRAELRQAFRAAFKTDIGLDWAAMTRLYLRVAEDFGEIPDNRSALDAIMAEAKELEKQGDGFRSFAGVALALLTYPNRVLLLDEPEAFLHPAQARVLGRWVATQAATRPAQIIVATHSADFLAGLVAVSEDAKILRLNRIDMCTRFHEIPRAITSGLIESPLLSSQPVLDSLFHRGVVVCEGDPDRAVYQTVAQHFHPGQRGEDFLFIHSNGKDAAKFPANLLRESGTPVCVIADFDLLNSEAILGDIVEGLTGSGLTNATKVLRADVSTAVEAKSQEQSLEELKADVSAWIGRLDDDLRRARKSLVSIARAGSNKWDKAKKLGVTILPDADQVKARELIAILASLGLFVVPCGELESWMNLGLSKGSRWNQGALQALHANNCPPALQEFLRQVLDFLDNSLSQASPEVGQTDIIVGAA